MDRYLKDQRVVLAIAGIGAALLALIFALLLSSGRGKPSGPPPASQSGLQVSLAPAPALNAGRPLRCFVNGQMVGELTLAECAQRNGVAAQSLDVGRDENGALTAAPTASLAPVPVAPAPQQQAQAMAPPITAGPAIDQGPPAACLHYVGSNWVTLSEGMTQGACLRALFAGKCVRPGEADYGHWGETTVRLIFPSQVQVSPDNRSFHTLYDQGRACEGPPVR